jgi:hypothetical protein
MADSSLACDPLWLVTMTTAPVTEHNMPETFGHLVGADKHTKKCKAQLPRGALLCHTLTISARE